MKMDAAKYNQERLALGHINALADHIRELRRDTVTNSLQIKALTGDLQARWVALRVLRAPPVTGDVSLPDAWTRKARTPQSKP